MSTLTSIESKVRYLLNDTLKSDGKDIFEYTTSNVFTLTEALATSLIDEGVLINDDVVSDSYISYDTSTQKVTITDTLVNGDTVEINYNYYPRYSTSEIQNRIRSALIHLSVKNYYHYELISSTVYPEPTPQEENLIAMITAIILKPENKTYRLPDITINAPNSSLTTDDLISKTISLFKKNSHGIFSLV